MLAKSNIILLKKVFPVLFTTAVKLICIRPSLLKQKHTFVSVYPLNLIESIFSPCVDMANYFYAKRLYHGKDFTEIRKDVK